MKSKNYIYLTGISLFIITVLIITLNSFQKSNLKILTTSNSYALEYAKKNNINYELVADTEKEYYTEKIENYSYDYFQNGIEITKYNGKSDTLIIPISINNNKVLSIASEAFKNSNVSKIVLPPSLINLDEEAFKDYQLVCYNTSFCKKLQDNADLNVTILSDSDYYISFSNNIPYEYNIGGEIEIVKYTGDDDSLIIPESIDGYNVTSLKLDIAENIKEIYLPSTIKNLELRINNGLNTLFYLLIILDISALILFLIVITCSIKKMPKETFYNAPIIILSMLYLLGIFSYSILAKMENYTFKNVFLTIIIIMIIYGLLSISLINTKKKIKNYDKKISRIDTYIKDTLELLNSIDTKNYNSNSKKIYEEVKELIKYSDPVSSDETISLEEEIQTKLKNSCEDEEYWEELKALIQKRNRICKDNK